MLGARSVHDSAGSVEAIEYVRANGIQLYGGQAHFANVYCYANSSAFPIEIGELNSNNSIASHSSKIPTLLRQEHDCVEFMQWQKGRSPKEHSEMELLKKVQAMHVQHRREDTERQDEFEDRIERRHQEMQTSSRRQHAVRILMQFLLAILGGAVALVGARLIPWWN